MLMDVLRWHVEQQIPERHRGPERSSLPVRDRRIQIAIGPGPAVPGGAQAIDLGKHVTPRAMRRSYQDLARAAEMKDLVTRAISGHATEQMQQHYSTVDQTEMRRGIAKIISLAGVREAMGMGSMEVVRIDPKTKTASWALHPIWPIPLGFSCGRCRD